MEVRYGAQLGLYEPSEIRETVARLEDGGFEVYWCGDHVIFTGPTERYAACGPPEVVAERITSLVRGGVRDFNLDFLGPIDEQHAQTTRFAREVRDLIPAP